MPKATDNRPVVGTLHCAECKTVASLYQAKRGRVKGLLYKRCGCGCDQRTGAAIQAHWRREMTPRPGYEDLKTTEQEPVQEPKEAAPGAVLEPTPEPKREPKREPKAEPIARQPRRGGLWVLFAAGAALLAVTGVSA